MMFLHYYKDVGFDIVIKNRADRYCQDVDNVKRIVRIK